MLFRKNSMPFVEQIFIYPVKSLGPVQTQKAYAERTGFKYDRQWMLVDADHQFVTQRSIPLLSQFGCDITGDVLSISFQDNILNVPLTLSDGTEITTKVWDDMCVTKSVGREADEWFSDLLSQKLKLVRLKDNKSRQHTNSQTSETLDVSLADGYPYLVLGQGSLNHLNDQLNTPVSVLRFRPNIVVADAYPHAEDSWKDIRAGHAVFQNVKPCARCQVIQIDPKTSVVSAEPTKTLSAYRKQGNKILFGSLYTCLSEGWVSVGDHLHI
jgi:uncharacterized protein YcbX